MIQKHILFINYYYYYYNYDFYLTVIIRCTIEVFKYIKVVILQEKFLSLKDTLINFRY